MQWRQVLGTAATLMDTDMKLKILTCAGLFVPDFRAKIYAMFLLCDDGTPMPNQATKHQLPREGEWTNRMKQAKRSG